MKCMMVLATGSWCWSAGSISDRQSDEALGGA